MTNERSGGDTQTPLAKGSRAAGSEDFIKTGPSSRAASGRQGCGHCSLSFRLASLPHLNSTVQGHHVGNDPNAWWQIESDFFAVTAADVKMVIIEYEVESFDGSA
jgi:hypothetical protein